MAEIIERGIIHFFSSAGVYLIALTWSWMSSADPDPH